MLRFVLYVLVLRLEFVVSMICSMVLTISKFKPIKLIQI